MRFHDVVGALARDRGDALGGADRGGIRRAVAREIEEDFLVEDLTERTIELDGDAEAPGGELDHRGEGPGVEAAQAAELTPRGLGSDACGRDGVGRDDGALGARPGDPMAEAPGEQGIERGEVTDVRVGVGELGRRQGPLAPVGPLLLLAERQAEQVVREGGEPDLVTDPGERGHELGVDHLRHLDVEPGGEQGQILARGVRDDVGMRREGPRDGADVDGEGIEDGNLGRRRDDLGSGSIQSDVLRQPRDLNEAQDGHQPVRRQELEVEGHEGCGRDRARNGFDVRGHDDKCAHGSRYLDILLDSAPRTPR